jgi:hypothetical protein
MMERFLRGLALLLLVSIVGVTTLAGYNMYKITRPVQVHVLTTPWTGDVDPGQPLPEYPRPQLRRDGWQNLNGRWQYKITGRHAKTPEEYGDEIVVPFAIESFLSGVRKPLLPDERLWYRRVFDVPFLESGQRLLLHFGAVDWEAEVWLNGVKLGIHRGGYAPFTFDITDALLQNGTQELVVAVWDPTNFGPGAYGKQHLVPHGIRYTAVSGIWQTVWLEAVPASRIDKLTSSTNLVDREVTLRIDTLGAGPEDQIEVTVTAGNKVVSVARTVVERNVAVLRIVPGELRYWSPDDPFLYDVHLRLLRDGVEVDSVESYFGAREVTVAEDSSGMSRLFLNGRPIFHFGLLDQGWWPDGLYTAPTDQALAFDIEMTRRMGFNSIRKHVKVEPARWYWHADRMGLLVWQDMPTGDGGADRYRQFQRQALDILSNLITGDPWRELERPAESAALFRDELASMIDNLEFFTSIVAWVPFNEAWGQFDTDRTLSQVKKRDPNRLTDGPSGWFDTGSGDVLDLHMYGREADFIDLLPDGRAVVYGEFGGLGLPIEDHLAVDDGWGYAAYENGRDYENAYSEILSIIERLGPRGLSGAIYTQTTDVEGEINGLMTYDRRVVKIPPERLAELNSRVISSIGPETSP